MRGLHPDLPGAVLMSCMFLGLIAAAEAWRRFGSPKPEWTRKLVHVGGGIACLPAPYLIESPWIILAMGLPLTLLFAASHHWGFLRSLHGVSRPSRGAEYYPLAVFLVFLLTPGRPWLFLAAVLVLAVADASATLVGGRYGRIRYQVEDEWKSLEGSLAFLVLAFAAVLLPMALLTELPAPLCVLAALLVAALVTGFEAISLEGADNLVVPLAVVVVLDKATARSVAEVAFQNASLLAIVLVVGVSSWRYRSLNVGGSIAFALFTYAAWSLGNWQWALPAFLAFALFLLIWVRRAARPTEPGIRVRVVAHALLPALAMLVTGNSFGRLDLFYGPFLAAFGSVVSTSLATSGAGRPARTVPRLARALARGMGAAAIVVLPPWVVQGSVPPATLVVSAGAVVLAAMAATAIEGRAPVAGWRWTAGRFLVSIGAAALVLAAQGAGVPAWEPRLLNEVRRLL